MVSWLVVPLDSYKTPKFTDLETGIQYWDFPALSGIRYSFRIRYNFLYLFSMPKLCHLSNSVYLQWLSVLSFHLFKNSLAYLSTHFLYYGMTFSSSFSFDHSRKLKFLFMVWSQIVHSGQVIFRSIFNKIIYGHANLQYYSLNIL